MDTIFWRIELFIFIGVLLAFITDRSMYYLEQCGLLNPLSKKDLFALHCVYLPGISKSIATLAEAGTTIASKLPTTARHCSFTQVAFCG